MKSLIFASAAALAFTAIPAAAQTVAATADGEAFVMTDTQEGMYDSWPADRQSAYDAWPGEVQEYYWTLSPAQTEGWWVLTDDQRVRVYEMTPEQRATAWTQISAQMNGATPATPAATANAAAMANPGAQARTTATAGATPRFVSKEMAQAAPTPKTPNAEYPPCKGDVQDNCVNPREAGLKYGNRALNYWPGKPASEIDGPMPAKKPSE